MNITIEVVPNSYESDEQFACCDGKITIHQKARKKPYVETFKMALGFWSIEDYQRQWREGLERIKTHDTSCLVTSVQNPYKRFFIVWWPLYKVGGNIFIQNELIMGDDYVKFIGRGLFISSTCYDFITPRITKTPQGDNVSEWVVAAPECEASTHQLG
jgi:hypothetical protein